MKNNFLQRKKDILSKLDKSSKKSWDEKIISLCEKINVLENYYTTSSCSGRVVLIVDNSKKGPGLFVQVWHDLVSFEELKKSLENCTERGISKSLGQRKNIIFKQEPVILHVACKSLEDARSLLDKAKLAGWKKSGIISISKRIIVELNGTEKLEFPITRDGEILVNNDFVKVIVDKSNENLKKSWEKIKKLKERI